MYFSFENVFFLHIYLTATDNFVRPSVRPSLGIFAITTSSLSTSAYFSFVPIYGKILVVNDGGVGPQLQRAVHAAAPPPQDHLPKRP